MWRSILYSWYKLHFYKKIKRCKIATFWFLDFFSFFFRFFLLKLDYFSTKSRKKNIWVFFPLILCHWSQFWHQKEWKNEIINVKNSDFCKLLRLCAISSLGTLFTSSEASCRLLSDGKDTMRQAILLTKKLFWCSAVSFG